MLDDLSLFPVLGDTPALPALADQAGEVEAVGTNDCNDTGQIAVAGSGDDDLYSPPICSCNLKGNCMCLPQPVRSIGEYTGSFICNMIRRARTTNARGHDNDILEEVSLWAFRLPPTAEAADGAVGRSTFKYFMVAHILYSPIRVIIVPMTPQPLNPEVLLLRFLFHDDLRAEANVDERGQLDLLLLYDYVHNITSAHAGWNGNEEAELHLMRVRFTVCDWDSIIISIDPGGMLCKAWVIES